MSTDYVVRAVEHAEVDAFWQIRLKALKDHPSAFGSDYEVSRQLGPSYAERGYFDGGVNRLFAAFAPNGDLVAQAGTSADTGKRSHIAHIISVYTHPDHRGKGLGAAVVQACIDHLQTIPTVTSIRISVNSNNVYAIRAYESLGFVTWGEEPDAIRTADGSCHNERHMVLTSGARRS